MSSSGQQSPKGKAIELILLVLVLVGLGVSGLKVRDNLQAFEVESAWHTNRTVSRWARDRSEYREIKLPFMLRPGYFQVDFTSSQSKVEVDVYAQDCLTKAFLDGKRVYKRLEECKPCKAFHKKEGKRCKPHRLELEVEPGKVHTLAMSTKIVKRRKGPRLLYLEHEDNAFGWRLLGLMLLSILGWAVHDIVRFGRGGWFARVRGLGSWIYRHRGLVFLALVSMLARLVITPAYESSDIYASAVVYAEDFFQKDGWAYATLDSDFVSAKYRGESHMHKPPGLYYQFALLRGLFGFGSIYWIYLTGLPPLIGDFLIAFVVYRVLRERVDESVAQGGAVFILLSAGMFHTSGVINRADSLAIAFLALATLYRDRKVFILWLGLAVASKQLALFAVPWFFLDRRYTTKTLLAGLVTLSLCMPYLLDNALLFIQRLALPQLEKDASGFAWLTVLDHLGIEGSAEIAKWSTRFMPLVILVMPVLVKVDKWTGVSLSYCIFVLMCKNVHEHYVMWSTVPLLISYIYHRRPLILGAAMIGLVSMVVSSDSSTTVRGFEKAMFGVMMAVTYFGATLDIVIGNWKPSLPFRKNDHQVTGWAQEFSPEPSSPDSGSGNPEGAGA